PMALLEAMALERPIVATAVGGIPGILRDGVNAVVVPPERPRDLARGIIRLLGDPDLAHRLGQEAAETARANFSNKDTAWRHLEVYRWVLAEKGSPRPG
ncbi:MAG: glycosyltransferase, partial [bacterium]